MKTMVYKIFRPHEWNGFKEDGVYLGSAHDQRDGFIHLCTQAQLECTIAKHYNDSPETVLAAFLATDLKTLKWEISRGGDKYPHLYDHLYLKNLASHKRRAA